MTMTTTTTMLMMNKGKDLGVDKGALARAGRPFIHEAPFNVR